MRVTRPIIGRARQLLRIRLVGDVDDRQRILVGREADFMADEIGIGSVVGDALCIVRIAVGSSHRK
jgi:hypothetical protein